MTDTEQPQLQATGLFRDYGPTRAVDDVNLTLHQGEILGLLGPNGAGKTTTLRMLTGALTPTAGRIEICGHDLKHRAIAAKRHIGYLPERPPLYPELTVNEYLRFCARLHGIGRRRLAAAIESARADCELDNVADRLIGNISKGYQQRVGIAQAIMHRPDVVILDEPTAGLDPHQIRQIRAVIMRLAGEHSVIVSSHILPEIQAMASRVMLIHQGRVALDASMSTLEAEAGDCIRLGLRTPPPAEALTAIAGVAAAQPLDDDLWRITPAAGADPIPEIARAAVANNWGLFELAREQRTLEELFVERTTRDEAEAA